MSALLNRALAAPAGRVVAAPASRAVVETVAPRDASSHVGQTVTIKGIVDGVHTASRSGVTFIDMGGQYPNNAFTGVIFREDTRTRQRYVGLWSKADIQFDPIYVRFQG